jgi:hypothetical protein
VPEWSLGDGPSRADASACDDADLACQPFGPPSIVTELVAPQDNLEKPTLTSDRLELYFLSDDVDAGPGKESVLRATRATTANPWSTPQAIVAVNAPGHEKSPAVSADGVSLWLATDRDGGLGGLDVWVSTRSGGTGGTWSAPVPVPELNTAGDEIPRPPGFHMLVMPLSVRASSSKPYQMESATRGSVTSSWSTPVAIASVDTANLDDDGFLTDDGLRLYFSSDRLSGTQDLFETERTDPAGAFATPRPLTALNTDTYAERDPWVSPDGHEIYFTSDRTGTLQIYRAVR